jgi:hypothetical protein
MEHTDGLDSLLDGEEPHATFHDAELLSVVSRQVVELGGCGGDRDVPDRDSS